jgi:hypothetical protein
MFGGKCIVQSCWYRFFCDEIIYSYALSREYVQLDILLEYNNVANAGAVNAERHERNTHVKASSGRGCPMGPRIDPAEPRHQNRFTGLLNSKHPTTISGLAHDKTLQHQPPHFARRL